MSTNEARARVSRESVWAVLADGWLYPLWVVGASRIRDVDPQWPSPGARIHHSVGLWPALLDDTTEVLAMSAGEMLRLRARAWPTGEATVTVTLAPDEQGTRIILREDATAGPARLVPPMLRRPLLASRNTETLRRLVLLAEGRAPVPRPHA